MARSDKSVSASDRLMGEVVRQLSDSAPPAPTWDDLHERSAVGPEPSGGVGGGARVVLAVAAVVVTIVAGLLLVGDRDDEIPADVPPTSVARTIPPVLTRTVWIESSSSPEIIDCTARASGRVVIDGDLAGLADREGLPGFDPATARLSAIDGVAALWTGVINDPRTSTTRIEAITPVLEAHAAATSGTFGVEPDTTQPGYGDDVERARDAVAVYSSRREPETCWWDTAQGEAEIVAAIDAIGHENTAACLAGASYMLLLEALVADQLLSDSALAELHFAGLSPWYSSDPPPALASLGETLNRIRTDPTAEFAELASEAQSHLVASLTDRSCPAQVGPFVSGRVMIGQEPPTDSTLVQPSTNTSEEP